MTDKELRRKRREIERKVANFGQESNEPDRERVSCGATLRRWLVIANLYIWIFICGALLGGGMVYVIAQGWVPGVNIPAPPPLAVSALNVPTSVVTESGIRVRVVNVERVSQDQMLSNMSQGVFLVVTLSLENTTNRPIETWFPSQDYHLTDRQGRVFAPDIEAIALWQKFGALNPGLSREIILLFNVPPNTRGYTLHVMEAELPLD